MDAKGVLALLLVGVAIGLTGCVAPFSWQLTNRAAVPVVVKDGESVTVVEPCTTRTLRWNNTWGGDPTTGAPVAEPIPSGDWILTTPAPIPFGKVSLSRESEVTRTVYGPSGEIVEGPCVGTPAVWSPEPSRQP